MKKLIILALILSAMAAGAQDKKVAPASKKVEVKNGQIVVSDTAKKSVEVVYKVIDGVVIYRGAKGGLYYYAVSKTGKVYKRYLKVTD